MDIDLKQHQFVGSIGIKTPNAISSSIHYTTYVCSSNNQSITMQYITAERQKLNYYTTIANRFLITLFVDSRSQLSTILPSYWFRICSL
jgi:hypothetical protein